MPLCMCVQVHTCVSMRASVVNPLKQVCVLCASPICNARMYKHKMQFKAMQQGKDLKGAVAMQAQPHATAGAATQAADIIVSAVTACGPVVRQSFGLLIRLTMQ